MKKLTLSTNGLSRAGNECQEVDALDHSVLFRGESRDRVEIVTVDLTTAQAFAIAIQCMYIAVDAGIISGWNVSFPEREDAVA